MGYPNAVTNLYQYDSLNRLTNLVWKASDTSLGTFAYTLGASGNRIGLSETISSTVARTYSWQYDKIYRLTNETITGTAPTGTLSYQYDTVGNRLNRSNGLGLPSQSMSYRTNDWLATDSYDSNGNTTASNGTNYQYDYENRLTNFNNGRVILVYDGDGNRVKKIIGTTTTLYLVDTLNPSGYPQVIEELTVSGGATNLSRAYTWGLSLISERIPGSNTNFYEFDGHGSTRFLTDPSGNIANTYMYDAFGNLINSTGTVPNNFLYCCYQTDPDVGLVYDNARYLNLNTGRFWTMDSDGYGDNEDPLSLHKYLYCEDKPINGADPSGHVDMAEQGIVGGLMASLGNFAMRIAVQGLTFAMKNPGLVRAFLYTQGFMTVYMAHENPDQAYAYFETGGFAADQQLVTSAASDLKSAIVIYKGTDDLGRSCGIFARLTRWSLDGGSPVPSSLKVPGWDPKQGLTRGHLLGDLLGGSGWRLENLTPIYRLVNVSQMKRIEEQVRDAVEAGETVDYRVTPIFEDDQALIPKYLKIEAKGDKGLEIKTTLVNVP